MLPSHGLDVLAIAAHPDDAELGCGGTLAKLARVGRAVGILDLTRGELGSRGSADIRDREAAEAAKVLGLAERRNAGLPDGGLDPSDSAQRRAVIEAIRELRPRLLLVPHGDVRHPDHGHASRLAEEAAFYAGLHRYDAAGNPFRPDLVLFYMERRPFAASLIVDVSEDFAMAERAVRAYRSQFQARESDPEPATDLTRPAFLDGIRARARFYGEQAGVAYGEPFLARSPLRLAGALLLLADPEKPGDGGQS